MICEHFRAILLEWRYLVDEVAAFYQLWSFLNNEFLGSCGQSYAGRPKKYTLYRLYKNFAPLSDSIDRSIVVVGHVDVGIYFSTAECQAMWATAYLDNKLKVPSLEER